MKRWSWSRDVVLPVGQATMESLALHAMVLVGMALASEAITVSFWLVVGLQAAVAVIARTAVFFPIAPLLSRLAALLLCCVLVWIWLHLVIATDASWGSEAWTLLVTRPWSVPPVATHPVLSFLVALAIYLAGRGLIVGLREQTIGAVTSWFLIGCGVLIALFTVVAATSVSTAVLPIDDLRSIALAYFVVGLTVTALAHQQAIHQVAGLRWRLSLSWLMAIATPIVLVVGAGLVIAGGIAAPVQAFVALLIRFVAWLIAVVWVGILWIWQAVLLVYRWLESLLPAESESAAPIMYGPPPSIAPPEMFQRVEQYIFSVLPADVTPVLLVTLFLLLAALFLRALLKGRTSRQGIVANEESFSIWSWRLLRDQMIGLGAAVIRKLRSSTVNLLNQLGTSRSDGAQNDSYHDIRGVYRSLLRWAEERGHTRAIGTTPSEFVHELSSSSSANARYIELITAYYVDARYGDLTLDSEKLRTAVDLARDLRSNPHSTAEQTKKRHT